MVRIFLLFSLLTLIPSITSAKAGVKQASSDPLAVIETSGTDIHPPYLLRRDGFCSPDNARVVLQNTSRGETANAIVCKRTLIPGKKSSRQFLRFTLPGYVPGQTNFVGCQRTGAAAHGYSVHWITGADVPSPDNITDARENIFVRTFKSVHRIRNGNLHKYINLGYQIDGKHKTAVVAPKQMVLAVGSNLKIKYARFTVPYTGTKCLTGAETVSDLKVLERAVERMSQETFTCSCKVCPNPSQCRFEGGSCSAETWTAFEDESCEEADPIQADLCCANSITRRPDN